MCRSINWSQTDWLLRNKARWGKTIQHFLRGKKAKFREKISPLFPTLVIILWPLLRVPQPPDSEPLINDPMISTDFYKTIPDRPASSVKWCQTPYNQKTHTKKLFSISLMLSWTHFFVSFAFSAQWLWTSSLSVLHLWWKWTQTYLTSALSTEKNIDVSCSVWE